MHGPEYEKAYSDVLSVLRSFNLTFLYSLHGPKSSYRGQRNQIPLIEAAIRGDLLLAQALIWDGASVDFRPGGDGLTAIESVMNNYLIEDIPTTIKMIELLLDSRSTEAHTSDISTLEAPSSEHRFFSKLLSSAVNTKVPIPVVQFLLQRAPKETYFGWAGRTILGLILEDYEDPGCSRLGSTFLDCGADPNAEDEHTSSGWNCCFTAAAHGVDHRNWTFTKLCLDRGSSMKYGISKGHCRSLVHLLVRQAFEVESPFREPEDKTRDRKEVMQFLSSLLSRPEAQRVGIVDVPDFQGITPLMWAIFWALPSCATVLVRNGADTTGTWLGTSLLDLVDVCKAFKVPEGFDISDDQLTLQMRTVAFRLMSPSHSKATYLKQLDEISLLLYPLSSSSSESASVVSRNTNLPLR